MASAVDIANVALSHIGAEGAVSSLSPPDGSVEAGHCARFYPIARVAALTAHNWSFARTRVALAQLTNDSEVWAYKYQLPADCIKARRILQYDDAHEPERNAAPFATEGQQALYTNQPEAVLIYTKDVTDTTKFTPLFVTGLGMLLASYVAGPIIKGSAGMSIGDGWAKRAQTALAAAAASDANASTDDTAWTPGSIAARA